MSSNCCSNTFQWLHPHNQDKNVICAIVHMITITLVAMSMVKLDWFVISGGVCTPSLSLSLFFSFGYTYQKYPNNEYNCINETIVNMMRVIILLCFMAIIFSLCGYFLHIVGPKSSIYNFMRKYAMASTCTVLWVLAIISTCYYVAMLLDDSLADLYPSVETVVSYGYGFYLITAAGAVSVVGTFCILTLMNTPTPIYRADDTCLIDDFNENNMDTFNSQTPPPPYSAPPPPYTP
ncbi:transmembrane protein 127-like [Onthophagus taurus]|uniref:transmembrane protein 127-like n=1 Tax=Onthophagus taurus TaxID=166361 RepID=UPI000C20C871|nr:transmembrane protein 127-like [Onthophagus taurus]